MQSITNKRICESCGTTDGGGSDKKLLECAGCLSSYFCNTQCQQQSWQLHKKVCRQRKKSIVKIQSTWRGWYTRRQLVINDGQDRCEVCGALDSKDKQLNICNGCKLSLFCSVRCQEYAWKKKNHKIICQERQMTVQLKSVVRVQSSWRGFMCRLAITKYKERAVLKIQTAWKAYMKVKRDKIRLEKQISKKLHKKSKQRAALKIQSAWKVALQRRELDERNKLNAIKKTVILVGDTIHDASLTLGCEDTVGLALVNTLMYIITYLVSKHFIFNRLKGSFAANMGLVICHHVSYPFEQYHSKNRAKHTFYTSCMVLVAQLIGILCLDYAVWVRQIEDEEEVDMAVSFTVPYWFGKTFTIFHRSWACWVGETIIMTILFSHYFKRTKQILFLLIATSLLLALYLQGILERHAKLSLPGCTIMVVLAFRNSLKGNGDFDLKKLFLYMTGKYDTFEFEISKRLDTILGLGSKDNSTVKKSGTLQSKSKKKTFKGKKRRNRAQ